MRSGLLRVFALIAAFSADLPASDTPKPAKPNVLLIISDDQGYGDFGFNGNRLVKTPNLDRLASESAVFRNFVVAAACSPSRAAIYTGREHLLTGVWGVPPRANLRRDEVLMPAFFKAAGYRTQVIGKLDTSQPAGSKPWDAGWDDGIGGAEGYRHRDPNITRRSGSEPGQGWTVDIWTDLGIGFIRENAGEPWLLTLAYIIPHMPWVCDEKYSAPFREQGCSEDLATCYGSIAHLDECIGRVLAALRETGQERNTVVTFLSDNGQTGPEAKLISDNGIVSGPDWERRNVAGLRGSKATIWENGIRVPFLLRWPERIPPGSRKQFGCAEDILPTVLDLAGIDPERPARRPFTGVSLAPSLKDPAATFERPAAFRIAIARKGSPRAPRGVIPDPTALRLEDHHLTLRGSRFKYHALPGGEAALHDLEADPGEAADVREQHPEVTATMAAECRRRWEEITGSGRAFRMPAVLVDGGQEPIHVPGTAAQSLAGKVRIVREAIGFGAAGDSASYALDVVKPGPYLVTVRGDGADTCAPLTLRIGDKTYPARKTWKGAAHFGAVELPKGEVGLRLTAGDPAPNAAEAHLRWINLVPAESREGKH